MKKWLTLFVVAVMMLSLVACGNNTTSTTTSAQNNTTGTAGDTDAAPTEEVTDPVETSPEEETTANVEETGDIVIGCLQDITGATSTLGKMVEAGAKWRIDMINEAGGINGRQIKMITYDTKADVNEAISAFTRAVTSDNVSAIIGPPIANIALAIAPISEQYDVPVLGFSLDRKSQVKEDGSAYKNMFAFQPNADQQGTIMASYAMDKNGFKKFGAIYNQGNAYSNSLLTPFVTYVEENGGEMVEPVPYTANDKDFKTLLQRILDADVEAIYVPNYTQELILITQQARALGFEGALICGLDACPPFNNLLGEPADNIYFINNIDDTEQVLADLISEVKEKNGIDATNKFFLGYDVAGILAKTFEEVGTDSMAVRDAIENLKDFPGLTGSLSIDPATHTPVGLEMVMFKYEGSTPVMLERYSVK